MTVLTEIKYTVAILGVLHLVAFVVMTGHRWHTRQYYIAEALLANETAELATATLLNANNIGLVEDEDVEMTEEEKKLEEYHAQIEPLSQRLTEALESIVTQNEAMDRHQETRSLLAEKIKTLGLSSTNNSAVDEGRDTETAAAATTTSSSLTHWKKFLSVGSLREIPDDELNDFFLNTAEEIMTVVQAYDQDNSDAKGKNTLLAKQFVLDSDEGANVEKKPSEFVCPGSSFPEGDDPSNTEDDAYESDMADRLEKFEEIFANRTQEQGIHALTPESRKSIHSEVESKLKLILEDLESRADDLAQRKVDMEEKIATMDNESGSSCFDEDLVATLVSAGVEAQMARADVREALRKAVLEYDPNISDDDLILDADLGVPREDTPNRAHSHDGNGGSINLRSMIDSPLLKKSVDWIDALVDAVGGYNDELDQYLDDLIQLHDTTSIGKIVVEKTLEKVGRVPDLNVAKFTNPFEKLVQSITKKK